MAFSQTRSLEGWGGGCINLRRCCITFLLWGGAPPSCPHISHLSLEIMLTPPPPNHTTPLSHLIDVVSWLTGHQDEESKDDAQARWQDLSFLQNFSAYSKWICLRKNPGDVKCGFHSVDLVAVSKDIEQRRGSANLGHLITMVDRLRFYVTKIDMAFMFLVFLVILLAPTTGGNREVLIACWISSMWYYVVV